MARDDYRTSHVCDDTTKEYNEVYARGYYAAQWQQIERPLLRRVFKQLADAGAKTHVDIACGQGRITYVAAEFFESVTGVDISPSMLQYARNSPAADDPALKTKPLFIEHDLHGFQAPEPVDVMSAFRLFLNAEDSLRHEALQCVARNLKPGGAFVTNIHCASSAPLGWYYKVDAALRGTVGKEVSLVRNCMSLSSFSDLLGSEGFEVDDVHRYSILPRISRLTDPVAEIGIGALDKALCWMPFMRPLCQAFLVVARRKG